MVSSFWFLRKKPGESGKQQQPGRQDPEERHRGAGTDGARNPPAPSPQDNSPSSRFGVPTCRETGSCSGYPAPHTSSSAIQPAQATGKHQAFPNQNEQLGDCSARSLRSRKPLLGVDAGSLTGYRLCELPKPGLAAREEPQAAAKPRHEMSNSSCVQPPPFHGICPKTPQTRLQRGAQS